MRFAGWDGRIRTYGTLYQKQLPYHLATSQQQAARYCEAISGSSPEVQDFDLFLGAVFVQQIFGFVLIPLGGDDFFK